MNSEAHQIMKDIIKAKEHEASLVRKLTKIRQTEAGNNFKERHAGAVRRETFARQSRMIYRMRFFAAMERLGFNPREIGDICGVTRGLVVQELIKFKHSQIDNGDWLCNLEDPFDQVIPTKQRPRIQD